MARQGPRWQQKANIRANKPVPERRTQSHAVADAPPEGSPDEPECDGAGRSDTSSYGSEGWGFEFLRAR